MSWRLPPINPNWQHQDGLCKHTNAWIATLDSNILLDLKPLINKSISTTIKKHPQYIYISRIQTKMNPTIDRIRPWVCKQILKSIRYWRNTCHGFSMKLVPFGLTVQHNFTWENRLPIKLAAFKQSHYSLIKGRCNSQSPIKSKEIKPECAWAVWLYVNCDYCLYKICKAWIRKLKQRPRPKWKLLWKKTSANI